MKKIRSWFKSPTALAMLVLTLLLILISSVTAMSSPSYRLDWFAPMTGSGGTSSSAHYTMSMTVGQTASGLAESAHYSANLGFWQDIFTIFTYLPVLSK